MKKWLLVPAAAVVLAGCSMQNSNPNPSPTMLPEDEVMSPGASPISMEGEEGVLVGGSMMVPSKTIGENAMMSQDHTTLLAAVEAAGLSSTLNSTGPFTVFAPTNTAFDKLPEGRVDELMDPANKAELTKILTYHVVPGSYTSTQLTNNMKLTTVQGQELVIMNQNGQWWVQDAMGNKAMITIPDVISSNGVTFVIDTVLMPK